MNLRHAFRNTRALGLLAALGGLAQGMERPGPAADGQGSAAPAQAGLDDATKRARVEALFKQTSQRVAALAVELSMAEVQLAKAEDLPAIAGAEALVGQRRKELDAATRLMGDLDGRLNGRGEAEAVRAEGKGDSKAPGAGEERKAGAGSAPCWCVAPTISTPWCTSSTRRTRRPKVSMSRASPQALPRRTVRPR
jgi:hypothetical protein